MLSTKDLDYIDTKLVKQGKKVLNRAFVELIEWVDQEFQVRPINVYYDINKPFDNPRINIVLETHTEEQEFRQKNKFSFDKKKQDAIKERFIEIINVHGLTNDFRVENLLVIFSSFAPISVSEATMSISRDSYNKFYKKYKTEFIWDIHQSGSGLIIFFYKKEDIEKLKNHKIILEIEEEYYKLIKPYDEFNYIRKTSLYFDSKEKFEKSYNGNWMNYYR
ncbi:hypothetical protein GYB22_13735 [bacterium]|nr:hypothetical protein [bacterium]